ncbi:hypothetical protein BDA96_10G262900 [Sorghum bicolor]|uniref:glycerophosphodiester phosphodiesterase n=1 Tax=Sorghum bicolor TaxID=4558 RepID=A0A921Q4S1_SORBI|nr:hypothetical protein BDA96_10G262900 [Sorghum bicolor]
MGVIYPLMFLFLLLLHGTSAALKDPVQKWQTLSGAPPLVIARGGYSGLFPDSSQFGYQFALSNSLPEVVLFCDLQLSSDNVGFCKTGLALDDSTLIAKVFPKNDKTYKVNGDGLHGWFSVDFTSNQLMDNVTLIQNVLSRPSIFDGTMGISLIDDVVELHPPQLWINIQYGQFFLDHKLNIEEYISSKAKEFGVNYVSSPEVGFLKSLSGKLGKSNVKLVFRFLDQQLIEPSTKQPYGTILKDLKSVKAFASGILVPKTYIWPVNKDQYLQPATTLVKDAHGLDLEF